MSAAYLDASAFVKLLKREPETDALLEALAQSPVWCSSELLIVEAHCTARRLGESAALRLAEERLTGIDLLEYTSDTRDLAARSAFDPPLRALDAIHLATALTIQAELGAFVAYDEDLRAAAVAEGLDVKTPGA